MWAVLISLSLFFATPVRAVELVIFDPHVQENLISLTASLSATSNYYLQGTLRSASSSKYFGETVNAQGNWIDYVSNPEKEYIASNFFVTEINNASWSGILKLRFKLDDPNYFGPGSYELKLRRFTGNSTSPAGESNTLIVNLTAATPAPSPSLAPSPSPSPSPTPTPTPTPIPSPSPSPIRLSPTPLPSLTDPSPGSVAGQADIDLSAFGHSPTSSPSSSPLAGPTLNRNRARLLLTTGGGLSLLSLSAYLGLRIYRRRHIINE